MNIEGIFKSVAIKRSIVFSAASIACAVLLALSALVKFSVPGSPVPATLQTFALLALSGVLGRYYALQMVGWYVLLGILGAPFFAEGAGWQHLIGATGGYIWGFFLAAWVVSVLSQRTNNLRERVFVYMVAALALYIPGLLQLKAVTGDDWTGTLQMGLYPFVFVDMFKALLAASGVCLTSRLFK